MLGVSKLVSVLGVPGEQPRHNSRVEWAGESAGEGKWIACYGAFQTLTPYKAFVDYNVLNLPVFTPADKPASMW